MGACKRVSCPGASGYGISARAGTYRYITEKEIEGYLACGWIKGRPASVWSWFMWACPECNPEGERIPQYDTGQGRD
jgi:hypothetical protein